MGGGRSFGKMPPIKRQVTPPQKTPQSGNTATTTKKTGGMGLLGGLAAGLGLAALASYLGVGEELMGLLLIIGIVFLCFFAFRAFFSRGLRNLAVAGPSARGLAQTTQGTPMQNQVYEDVKTNSFREENFDWEISDKENFLEVAKSKFIELQQHWATGNLSKLNNFCTSDLMTHLKEEYKKEDSNTSAISVVELDACLEGSRSSANELGQDVLEVFIRFEGLMRHSGSTPTRFNEVWTLQQTPSQDEGWLLSGIYQDEQDEV